MYKQGVLCGPGCAVWSLADYVTSFCYSKSGKGEILFPSSKMVLG